MRPSPVCPLCEGLVCLVYLPESIPGDTALSERDFSGYAKLLAAREGRCVRLEIPWYRGGPVGACVNMDGYAAVCPRCAHEIVSANPELRSGTSLGWTCPNPECESAVTGKWERRPAARG
jgi:hypothetical protein